MKIKHLIILFFLVLISCKRETNVINIVLTKNEKKDSTSIQFRSLSITNSDSIIYFINNRHSFKFQDTIKIEDLSIGEYRLEYLDLVGNIITKNISLNENVELKIIADSIDIRNFENKTPILNLKSNASYIVNMQTGGNSSFYGYYKISRIENQYFIESYRIKKRQINPSEFNQIKKFESELLAVNGKNACTSTSRTDFEIITDGKLRIKDVPCYWNGWFNLFNHINN